MSIRTTFTNSLSGVHAKRASVAVLALGGLCAGGAAVLTTGANPATAAANPTATFAGLGSAALDSPAKASFALPAGADLKAFPQIVRAYRVETAKVVVDVGLGTDGKTVCITPRLAGATLNASVSCIGEPDPDKAMFTLTRDAKSTSVTALTPDGISSFSAKNADGQTAGAIPGRNIAVATLPGQSAITEVSWVTANGETVRQPLSADFE